MSVDINSILSKVLSELATAKPCRLCAEQGKKGVEALGTYTLEGIPFKLCRQHYQEIASLKSVRASRKQATELKEIIFPEDFGKEEVKEEKKSAKAFVPPIRFVFDTIDLINLFSLGKEFDEDLYMRVNNGIIVRELSGDHIMLLEAVIRPSSGNSSYEAKMAVPIQIVQKVLSRRKVESVLVEVPSENRIVFRPDNYTTYEINTLSSDYIGKDKYRFFEGELSLGQPKCSFRILRKDFLKLVDDKIHDYDYITFEADDGKVVVKKTGETTSEVTLDRSSEILIHLDCTTPVKSTYRHTQLLDILRAFKTDFVDLKFYGDDMPIEVHYFINSESYISVYIAPVIPD